MFWIITELGTILFVSIVTNPFAEIFFVVMLDNWATQVVVPKANRRIDMK
ncbi:MAG: hypothetical protein H7068_12060 [Pedobacter sp.]|nr:hypothetical protein [Chitinophagaceae bacterium]